MRASLLAFVPLALLHGVGCTFVNDPADHRSLPADALCEELAELGCAALLRCCPDAAGSGDELQRCIAAATADCENPPTAAFSLERLAMDPSTGYDGVVAAQTIAVANGYLTSCDLELADWYVGREGFIAYFRGTRERRAPCPAPTAEDATSLFSCAGLDTACRYEASSGWQCRARGLEGESCILPTDCAEGFFCEVPEGTLGSCLPRRPPASPCDRDEQCDSLSCVLRLCGPRTQRSVYCPDPR